MEITWTYRSREYRYRVEQHVKQFAEVIGLDAAVKLILDFGGSDLYVPAKPSARSALVKAIGRDAAVKLSEAMGGGHFRIPIARHVIVRYLFSRGEKIASIARLMRTTEPTVRKHLKGGAYVTEVAA